MSNNAPPTSGSFVGSTITLKPGNKKIPDARILEEIPLESCKAYPIRIFQDLGIPPRIAVADVNSRNDPIDLLITWNPLGCKTALHPQVGFIVKGPYHMEQIGYPRSNPYSWNTWIEFYLDGRYLNRIIDSLIRLKLRSEGIQC